MLSKRKRLEARLEALEEQAHGKETIIGIVDVRDLEGDAVDAAIAAKRAELKSKRAPAALIILQYERGK